MHRMPHFFHRNYLYLCGVICGIVFAGKLPAFYPVLAAGILLTLWLLKCRARREITIYLAATAAGMAGYCLHNTMANAPLQNCRLTGQQVRICDSNALGSSQFDDDILPYRIAAETTCGQQKYKLHLRFPKSLPNPGVADGEEYLVSGSFYQPQPITEFYLADASGRWQDVSSSIAGQGYNNYLALNGISGELIVEDIQKVSGDLPAMTRFRQIALERLDRGIEQPQRRAILGAITLGMRSRLDSDWRYKFAATGVAHLFSVSGLHVGVLAVLILLALRPLPGAWHWLITGTIFFYVAATGGNTPAIRAFIMVLLMEFFKSRLLRIRALELLSLIAAGLLLYNPYYLCDGGFQYSFAVTAMLIKVSAFAGEVARAAGGTPLLLGEIPRWKVFLYKLRGKLCGAMVFAATACLTSGILMLYHQNMFFAGSMLLNLLILPILTPLFAVSILKCLLPCGNCLWNILLNGMLIYLEKLVDFFYSLHSSGNWMYPHWLVVAIFLILLCLLIELLHSRRGVVVLIALALLIGFQLLQPAVKPDRLAVVISGGALEHPVCAIIQPQSGTAYLLNAGRDARYPFKSIAYYYGINHINRLDLAYPVADCADGLPGFMKDYPIDRVRFTGQKIRSKSFQYYIYDLPLQTGAKSDSLSSFDTGPPELKIAPHSSGSWLMQVNGQTLELKRTARARVYIVPLKD
ncbi:MAG: ComEC/Rec2 family competence protein [Lentisphaerae bacterium]|nr:ComEC/Rec2 family competence protein [Lentisphaerota bacterium]